MNTTQKNQPEFSQTEHYTPRTPEEKMLVKMLHEARDEKEIANLLRDCMTTKEISEIANRIQIASLLYKQKHSYLEIAEIAKTSTTTVTRVAHWLYKGCGGYYTLLKRILK